MHASSTGMLQDTIRFVIKLVVIVLVSFNSSSCHLKFNMTAAGSLGHRYFPYHISVQGLSQLCVEQPKLDSARFR